MPNLTKARFEKYFDAIFNSSKMGVGAFDQLLGFRLINPALLNLLGYEEKELMSRNLYDIIASEDDRKQCAEAFEAMQGLSQDSYHSECRMKTKGGASVQVQLSICPLYTEDYQLDEVLVTVLHINEHKSEKNALKDKEATISSILNATQDAIFSIDRQHKLRTFNTACKNIISEHYGIALQAGMHINEITDKAFGPLFNNYFLRAFEGESSSTELKFPHGCESYYAFDFTPIQTDEKDNIGCTVYCKNITELKEKEKALKGQEKIFRSIFEQSPIGIVFSTDDKCNRANLRFCNMLGYTHEDIAKMEVRDFTHPDDVDLHVEKFRQLMSNRIDHFTIEKRYVSKKGEVIPARTTVARIHLPNNEFGTQVALIQDLSDQKKIKEKEQELLQLRESGAKEQKKLKNKLESMNRELSSNLMFISERNALLEAINQSLKDISSKAGYEIKHELFKITTKVKKNIQLDEAWGKFKIHFDQTHPEFFTKLRATSSKLTQKEIKQCAYIRIGLSNKETAQLLGVSPKSIEMARYRIKKKIGLTSGNSLLKFINNL